MQKEQNYEGNCPDEAMLCRHLAGEIDGELAAQIDAHFEDCPHCLSNAKRLDGIDEFAAQTGAAAVIELEIGQVEEALINRGRAMTPGDEAGGSSNSMDSVEVDGYRLVGTLGRGGMGVVYKAEDENLKRTVALKILARGVSPTDEDHHRFRTEAEAVARLHHPNIVQIYDVGQSNGYLFLSLEFIEGPTLAEFSSEQLHPREAAMIVHSVASAMHYAHSMGIVHRDLKPGNILIANSAANFGQSTSSISGAVGGNSSIREIPTPKIVDFGLAKHLESDSSQTRTGTVMGTASYMAPEQASGQLSKIGPRSDVYAIGAILYELLTGQPPFVGEGHAQTIQMVLKDTPARLRQSASGISHDLETICLKCLEKEPAKRYQTAELLANDLKNYVDGRPIAARPVGNLEHAWRWCSRNPVVSSLGAMCILLLAVGLTMVSIKNLQLTESNSSLIAARNQATAAQQIAEKKTDEAQQREALLTFQSGLRLAEEQEIPRGLMTMLRSLRLSPDDESNSRFKEIVRTNLASWIQWVPEFAESMADFDRYGTIFVDITPDERYVAFGFNHPRQGEVAIHDPASGDLLRTIKLPHQIAVLEFIQGGRLLALGLQSVDQPWMQKMEGNWVELYDVDTGRLVRQLPHPGGVLTVMESADERFLITNGFPETTHCWECKSWKLLAHNSTPVPTVLDNLRSELWVDGGNTFSIPDLQPTRSQKTRTEFRAGFPHPSGNAFVFLEQIRGGSKFSVTQSTGRSTIEFNTNFVPGAVPQLVFRNTEQLNGGRFWGQDELNRIRCLDLGTGRAHPTSVLANHSPIVVTSSESEAFAGAWKLRMPRTLSRPYAVLTGQQRALIQPGSNSGTMFQHVEYNSERTRAIVRDGGSVAARASARLIDLKTGTPVGQPIQGYGNEVRLAIWSPDERYVVTSNHHLYRAYGEVNLWDATSGEHVRGPLRHSNWISALAFSPDGKTLAAGDYQGQVRLWDVATGQQKGAPLEQSEIVWSLAWSPDSSKLAVGTTKDYNRNAHAHVWDIATGQAMHQWSSADDRVVGMVFPPMPQHLLVFDFHHIALWDFRRDIVRWELSDFPQSLRFWQLNQDGTVLTTASGRGEVRRWDVKTGQGLNTPLRHRGAATCFDYSPDGRLIVTSSDNGNCRLWDVETGLPLGPPVAHRDHVVRVAFANDGKSFLSTTASGHVRTWPIPAAAQGGPDLLEHRVNLWTRLQRTTKGRVDGLTREKWMAYQKEWDSLTETQQSSVRLVAPADDLPWHLARTADAEEDAFLRTKGWSPQHEPLVARYTAGWHLEKLMQLQPSNWLHYARRAMAAHGDFDVASEFYDMAAERTSPSTLANWYRHRVHDCELANEWEVAHWYLDRLIEMGEKSSDTYFQRAFAKRQLQNIEGAEADEDLAISHGLRDTHIVDIAIGRARAGNWNAARQVLTHVRDPRASLPGRSTPVALILLRNKAVDEYETFCQALLKTDAENDLSPGYRSAITECCSLNPLPMGDVRRAMKIANELATMEYKVSQLIPNKIKRLQRLARLQTRLGEYQTALATYQTIGEIRSIDEFAADEESPIDACFQSMANFQLHKHSPASNSYQEPEAAQEETHHFSWQREMLRHLRAEVSRLTD